MDSFSKNALWLQATLDTEISSELAFLLRCILESASAILALGSACLYHERDKVVSAAETLLEFSSQLIALPAVLVLRMCMAAVMAISLPFSGHAASKENSRLLTVGLQAASLLKNCLKGSHRSEYEDIRLDRVFHVILKAIAVIFLKYRPNASKEVVDGLGNALMDLVHVATGSGIGIEISFLLHEVQDPPFGFTRLRGLVQDDLLAIADRLCTHCPTHLSGTPLASGFMLA
jgi:hypothetical protein